MSFVQKTGFSCKMKISPVRYPHPIAAALIRLHKPGTLSFPLFRRLQHNFESPTINVAVHSVQCAFI